MVGTMIGGGIGGFVFSQVAIHMARADLREMAETIRRKPPA